MADVYMAVDRRLGRNVAVKILHSEYAASDAFVERFRREAQAAANLTHPGVVAIHDWGEDDGTYYMVMELVAGQNLRDVLRSEGSLKPRRVAQIGWPRSPPPSPPTPRSGASTSSLPTSYHPQRLGEGCRLGIARSTIGVELTPPDR
jgi:serine/threonine protein kinase